ncbi:hypothetical protein [Streptomyces sviceus]|uniref:hypothetical protein n=1 Tax=Streptomyces sviceus TaxID=285530 RepID=UPI0036890902
MAGQDAAQAGFVGDDLAVEDGMAGELGEPGFGFLSGGAREGRPAVVGAQLVEELAAGEGFFGLGLGLVTEAGVAGAGVALEHLDAQVAVLHGVGDGAARAAGDEPVPRHVRRRLHVYALGAAPWLASAKTCFHPDIVMGRPH